MKGRIITVAAAVCLSTLWACRTDTLITRGPMKGARVTAFESVEMARHSDASLAEAGEVDLVEQLIQYRTSYKRTLQQLHAYYEQHGYEEKRLWAAGELQDIGRVRPYHYLYDSEIARLDLSPRDRISEADSLYAEAMAVAAQAGHGTPVFFNQDKMGRALAMLKQLIREYPMSDKIDDAAFHCGEMLKEYYKNQDSVAVQWYERAWTWDPSTPHPARFQAAVVYDYRLHDRKRALELYRAVLATESSRTNARFALARIKELTETGPVDGERTVPVAQQSPSASATAAEQESENLRPGEPE